MAMSKADAVAFFSTLYGGAHHIPGRRNGDADNVREWGTGWHVNHYGDLATYDSDALTRLVLLAHDRAVRVEVTHGGPRMVRICIWQRTREGSIYSRHPTIEDAFAKWRERHPQSPEPPRGEP